MGNARPVAWGLLPFLVVLVGSACRSESSHGVFEQTDVFVAGRDGVVEYRIPVLLTSNKGTLLAFCDARVDKPGDPPNNIDLVMKRSTDGGRTWEPLRRLVDNGDGAAADSCGIVDRQTGTIWVFSVYAPAEVGSANAAPGLAGATFQYKAIRSDDDGLTWSAPIDLTAMLKRPEWSAGSTGVGKGIQMRSGRLVLPRYNADYHRPGWTGGDESQYSASHVSYSDDHGRTWTIGAEAPSGGRTNECHVVELADGSLLLNMRGTQGNRRKIARSRDGGAAWSEAVEDPALVEPRCQGSLEVLTDALRHDRNRLLFANPASTKRENMTVRLSYDEGATWPVARQVHAGPSAYSCLTVLSDATVELLYERGDRKPYEKITFARFDAAWLTDGKDSVAGKGR